MGQSPLQNGVDRGNRLFLLCHPHNPVGRCWNEDELRDLAAFAEQNDLIVCSDEIHCGLILDADKRHIPFASLSPDAARRSITLMAPSKTYNIPGLGCAFAVIPDAALRRRFLRAMDGIVPHVNVLGLVACEAAYRDCGDWHGELIAYLRGNRDRVAAAVQRRKGAKMSHVEATYLAWIDVRELGLANPAAHFEAHGARPVRRRRFRRTGLAAPQFRLHPRDARRGARALRGRLPGGMSSYTLTVFALAGALIAQAVAAGLATESFLRKGRPSLARRSWLALAIGSLLLALHHGYALELALSTGLHDLRQAVLAGVSRRCWWRSRCPGSGGWPERPVLGNDPVQPLVVRFGPDAVDPVDLEADAYRQRARGERGQRAVEIAAAVAEAITCAVESVERQQDQVGGQPLAGGRRRDAVAIGFEAACPASTRGNAAPPSRRRRPAARRVPSALVQLASNGRTSGSCLIGQQKAATRGLGSVTSAWATMRADSASCSAPAKAARRLAISCRNARRQAVLSSS